VRHPLVAALIRAYDQRDRARFEAREGMAASAGPTPGGEGEARRAAGPATDPPGDANKG
jgi:hypothetical protein